MTRSQGALQSIKDQGVNLTSRHGTKMKSFSWSGCLYMGKKSVVWLKKKKELDAVFVFHTKTVVEEVSETVSLVFLIIT